MNQGKFVILAMVGIGSALAGFGWWVRYSGSQQVLAVWGPQAVVAIRTGEPVELFAVGLPANGQLGGVIRIEPEDYPPSSVVASEPIDITKAPGLIHARHHLVHQKGFDWDSPRDRNCTPHWEVAMRFKRDGITATIVLDFTCNRAYLVERKTEVGMRPIIADALKRFLADFELPDSDVTHARGDALGPSSARAHTQ